ncbi:hypothetical protein M2139_000305 [Enterococcus sp. PF1-24]|uniref:hypothetical protein n=1 Tax=unclassified Enterococcus TaxID=2608891 RepID=UPI002473F824|nr:MULTISPECIES: hypothetical protein [unclassified Enterococcus]MDH6363275.1 hypothetical protein [Enterococcus sp. PFB1-1]MDH6400424.1 hypothetical protein [Enterococcus sp. PF1-24]
MKNKPMDNYEVGIELNQINNLLFVFSELLEGIQGSALEYRAVKNNSSKLLAYETDRYIDQLVTLQDVITDKVISLKNNLSEQEVLQK